MPPRAYEPDDPMVLQGTEVGGDCRVMLDSIIEEYAMMGWDAGKIEKLFDLPFFRATHGLMVQMGKDAIRRRIREVLGRVGVLRFDSKEIPSEGEGDHA